MQTVKDNEDQINNYLSINDIAEVESKIARYVGELRKLDRIDKRELFEEIFEKIVVIDHYSLKLELKIPKNYEGFHDLPKNGCDYDLCGGTSRT